jgi:hypothetical protein
MLIELSDKGVALAVPACLAEEAARLIASARVVENTYNTAGRWKPSNSKVVLSFGDDDVLTELSKHEIAANEAAEKSRSDWLKAYREAEDSKKRVRELETEIATIRSLTTCTSAAPVEEAPSVPQPAFDDIDLSF